MKRVAEYKGGEYIVKVFRDAEWNEYVCKLYRGIASVENSDYHTDDKEDALDTAAAMLDDAVGNLY